MENQTPQPANIEESGAISSPIPAPVNPPTRKSKLPRKIIIGIILLLLLAGSAVGFYVFKPQLMNLVSKPIPTPSPSVQKPSPTPDPKSSWKIYENQMYSFSIQYPSTFTTDDKSGQFSPFAMYFYDKGRTTTGEGGTQTNPYFLITAKPYQGTITEYLNNLNNNKELVATKKFGTYEFTIAKEIHGIGGTANEYLIKNNGYIISISPDLAESKDSIDYKLFDQILSTFQKTYNKELLKETKETANSLLTSFTNPNIEGMKFQYDPNIWEVTELTREKRVDTGAHNYGGTGVLMKEKKSSGSLLLVYNLAFGVGGGVTPLKEGDLINIKGSLSRALSYNNQLSITKYYYGVDNFNTHVDFSKSQDQLQNALKVCDTSKQSGTYMLFSEDACSGIKSGIIKGYLNQPTFSRSIRLKRLSNLGKIDSTWENDSYIKETGIDDGYIIIESEYIGENPTEADKIVNQFPFQ